MTPLEALLKMDAENSATPPGIVTGTLSDERWFADTVDGKFRACGKTRDAAIENLLVLRARWSA